MPQQEQRELRYSSTAGEKQRTLQSVYVTGYKTHYTSTEELGEATVKLRK